MRGGKALLQRGEQGCTETFLLVPPRWCASYRAASPHKAFCASKQRNAGIAATNPLFFWPFSRFWPVFW